MKTTIINKILLVLMLITAQQVSALEFQVDGIYYRTSIFTKNSAYVTHSGTSYTESVEYQGEVVIPESVTYNGKTYTIASIGGYAFAGCPGLTSVTIPNTVTTINQNAFNGCTGLKTIECKATTPPALGDNAFTSYDATLVVPSSSESVYKSAAGWSNFKFKEESSETPGSGNTGGGSGNDNGDDTGGSAVPEVCYLVGNYNGWSVPNIENVDDLYTLTDPDKDGVYYGKFYFNKDEFEFKIFLGIGDWSNGDLILGIEDNTSISMNNISETFTLQDSNSSNIACLGWIGGYVEIFFDFNNKTLRFTIPNENNTLVYKITSSTDVEVIAGTEKYTGDIVIPSQTTIDGKVYNVTKVGNKAFYECTGLTSVTIPNSVTSIGNYAFYYSSGLTSITIPEGVTSIGIYAFYYCSKLTSVTIGNSVTSIGDSAFSGCSGLTSVIIGNSVTSIGSYAFDGCSSLTSITIPNSVTSIGEAAFSGCSGLTSIVVESGNTVYDSRNNCNAIIETSTSTLITGCKNTVIPNSITSIGNYAFSGCSGLTSVTIGNSVTSIGGYAFLGCSGLTSVTIPNSVTSIGANAFRNCSGLTSVTIPNSVTSIGVWAFFECSSLTSVIFNAENCETMGSSNYPVFYICTKLSSVTIGQNVKNIPSYAFSSCSGLTSVTSLNPTPPTCGENVFKNVNVSNVTLTVPTGSVSIYKSADIWKDFKYEQTEEVPSEPELPEDTSGLSYNIINSTDVEVIAGAEKYTGDIVIPSQTTIDGKVYNITQIGDAAFQDCTNLTSVTIPNLVVSIGESALKGCINLISVVIGNSVTSIGNSAFYGCTSLTSVTIPNSVTSIGNYAFYGNSNLTSVTSLNPTPPTCGTDVFGGVNVSDILLIVPAGSKSLYNTTDTWKDFKYKVFVGDVVEVNGLSYKIVSETTVSLIAGSGKYSGKIVVPSEITIYGNKYNVIDIGDMAFYGCTDLTSVTIPNSVISIGDNAMKGCTGLTSVTIGNSVASIGSSAFYDCANLKDVFISDLSAWCKIDFGSSFSNPLFHAHVLNLNGTEIKDLVIPESVNEIKSYAFSSCTGLTSITIHKSVSNIGDYAFESCTNLTSITVQNPTPPTCGTNAFYNVSVENITLEVPAESVSLYQSADTWKDFGSIKGIAGSSALTYNILNETDVEVVAGTGKYTGDIVIPSQTTIDGKVYNVTKVGNKAFYECTGLTSVTIPNSVTSIGDFAFTNCSSLTSVTIPNSVTSIGNSAFSYCSGLTSVTIPNSVTNIGQDAFFWCSGLTSITISNSVTSIGGSAFSGCSKLTSITIPNSVTSIGSSAFSGCSKLTSITIPNSITSIGSWAFAGCSGLTSIIVESGNTVYDSRDNCNAIIETSTNTLITGCKNTVIPNGVTSIGEYAFYSSSGLTSISIPSSVTSIGNYAFSGCSGLTSITIPNSVTSIGRSAFNDCSGLTSVTIPNSVTSIGRYAFSGCSGLTSVTIPDGVTSIGDFAFYSCSGLTSITIPNRVTNIGSSAFSGCSGLTRVTSLSTTPPTCGTDVFYNVSVGNITLEVPAESVSMYQSADTWKDFGTIETYISYPVGLSKMWAIPADAATSFCSVRTGNGFGDTFFGSNYQAGVIEEWKDGVLVTSYDVNKFCADNNLGETVKVIDSETGTETEKFQSYLLWTAVMVDDAGNLLVNVGLGPGTASTCQNWVLLPASDRNAMQLLHIDEFPSADVTPGRVDVPSRIVGNITDGGAYLYIPATGSALMPVMYIALDGDGKIYYDAENSWILMSSVTFDASTNVATFQTADEILNAADEAAVAAKTYVRWRGRGAFTWNAETSQLEKNTAIPQGTGTPGMDIFKIGDVEYIVLPVNSATTGNRCSSIAVYNLADGSEVANWDSGCSVDYYVGSVQARVNPDGKTANIYVCGHKDCFGILKFYPGSSVKSIANEGLSYGKGSSALDEIVTEENAAVEYYNLQGVRVMNPEKGIYIKRQGGKTSKVVL